MIGAVLFDKDGTLFDFDATWTVWAGDVIKELGAGDAARTAAIAQALGYDLSARAFEPGSSVIAGTVREQAEAVLPFLPGESVDSLTVRFNQMAADVKQVEVTPLAPFLAGLKGRGLKLGVATNDAEASARAHLDSVGAAQWFDFVAGYDSGYGGKPAPGQLIAFAGAVDVAPRHCAMVGDSTHDLIAARAAGMRAVGVLTGPASAGTLAPHADVVLATIADLPEWIATQAG